ncbi:MAG: TfoX/Sxy family protein [Croceitalea sp.]|nr:TfoX/Sxy family protein [Croceitalea sp.]
MAYNHLLAERVQAALKIFNGDFTEKKMFGGIAFLYKGKMTVGVINDDLMVRVIGDKMNEVLNMKKVRPMDFTGKPMKEFVFVAAEAIQTEEQLQFWIELGLEHAKSKL